MPQAAAVPNGWPASRRTVTFAVMKAYRSFDEYVEDQPEASRDALRELRRIILEAAPDAEETINYNIPAFVLVKGGKREQQIMIAGFGEHVGLYPHPTTMEYFGSRLVEYKTGKGSVQFPLSDALPRKLIKDMVKYRNALVNGK